MEKKKFSIGICVIILTLIMSVALAACSTPNDDDNYDGNIKVTREIAEDVLSKVEFGDKMYWTEGNSEYGYNISSDGFVVYEKESDGDETYYGGSGEDFYKVMISSQERSYKRVTKWEAMLVLEKTKVDMTESLTIIKDGYLDSMLEEQKEYGSDFGNLIVSGNVYKEKPEDALPQFGSILYSIKVVQGYAALVELEFSFVDKKLMSITNRYDSSLQGYMADNIRNPMSEADSISFEYGRTLTMPTDKGTDVTNPQAKVSVYREGSSLPVLYNQTKGAKIQLGTPADEGTFLGWFYDEKYQLPVEGDYQVGFEDYSFSAYAKWQVPAIQTQLNGGAFAEGYQDSLSKCIFVRDIRNIIPYKKGYAFEGWYKEAAFENEVGYDDYTQITAATTVYAKWLPLVKITLSADGISYALPKMIGIEGGRMSIDDIIPVKRGGLFAGWFKDSGFQTPVTEEVFPAAGATYYAKFDNAICVDINFENASLTIDLDKYINIPLAESEEYGFEEFLYEITEGYPGGSNGMGEGFDGWYTDSALTQPLTAYPTSNITVYPKIAPLSYFLIDAGEGATTDGYTDETLCINAMKWGLTPISDILSDISAYLIPPEGKQFSGWYADAALTTPYEPTQYPTQDTTIYAGYVTIV
ncbi:MAG: InlB B-repeat-containing protein [Clostridia bacterium]|nr:InlB B-repeat-containing protein [Clostridia bacterium]